MNIKRNSSATTFVKLSLTNDISLKVLSNLLKQNISAKSINFYIKNFLKSFLHTLKQAEVVCKRNISNSRMKYISFLYMKLL